MAIGTLAYSAAPNGQMVYGITRKSQFENLNGNYCCSRISTKFCSCPITYNIWDSERPYEDASTKYTKSTKSYKNPKEDAILFFKNRTVSYSRVSDFLKSVLIKMESFYSHGKLLLSAEYLVLKGNGISPTNQVRPVS